MHDISNFVNQTLDVLFSFLEHSAGTTVRLQRPNRILSWTIMTLTPWLGSTVIRNLNQYWAWNYHAKHMILHLILFLILKLAISEFDDKLCLNKFHFITKFQVLIPHRVMVQTLLDAEKQFIDKLLDFRQVLYSNPLFYFNIFCYY